MTDAALSLYRLDLESRLAQKKAFLKERLENDGESQGLLEQIARESSSSWNNHPMLVQADPQTAHLREMIRRKQISMLVRHQISKLEVQRERIREQISKLEAEISSLRMLCTSQARGEGVIAGGVSRGDAISLLGLLMPSSCISDDGIERMNGVCWPNLASSVPAPKRGVTHVTSLQARQIISCEGMPCMPFKKVVTIC